MKIFMPNDLVESLENHNPGCIFRIEAEGTKLVPIDAIKEGWFICTRCGNRGIGSQPPLQIGTRVDTEVFLCNSSVVVRVKNEDIAKAIRQALDCTLEESGQILMMRSREIVTCSSCGGYAAPQEVLVGNCYDEGCMGCMYCGNLASVEEVAERCSNCYVFLAAVTQGFDNDQWRSECHHIGCKAVEASEQYYNLSIDKVYEQGVKTGIFDDEREDR